MLDQHAWTSSGGISGIVGGMVEARWHSDLRNVRAQCSVRLMRYVGVGLASRWPPRGIELQYHIGQHA